MSHAALNQLCTLARGLAGADGRQHATIPVTYWLNNMGCIYWAPGHPVGDVAVIELPRDARSRSPQASIPYLWIFEGASKEEVGFQPVTSCHQIK